MIKKVVVTVLLILFVVSCTESPTEVGGSLLPPSDKFDVKVVRTDTLNLTWRSEYFRKKLDLGAAPRILLGKFNGLTSTALLRFFMQMPDSIREYLQHDSVIVQSSWVEMRPNYVLGDETAPINFDVYKVNNFWIPADFDEDSLNALDYDNNPISSPDEVSDSLIKFSVPTDLTLNWLKKEVVDSLPENNGVMLKPDESSRKILGFQAITNVRHPDEPVMKIVYNVIGKKTDTLTQKLASDVHVITGEPEKLNSDNINLLADYAFRGYFYFDHSFLPKDAIINKAILKLSVDSASSFWGSVVSDSVTVQMVSDSTTPDSTVKGTVKLYLGKHGWIYEGRIGYFVQKWVDGTSNQGLLLRLSDESRSLNLISLFSEKAADKSKRPQIVIYYTDKK